MAIQLEDVLSAICTDVKLAHSNDFQKVFILTNAVEAKLAFDVLVAHGLEVKVYPQEDDTAKLYVTHPNTPPQQLEKALTASKIYTTTLKQIKLGLDQLQTQGKENLGDMQYSVAFANLQPNGKQIIIQISPAVHNLEVAPSASVTTSHAVTPPTQAVAAASAQSPSARRVVKKKTDDDFTSGPAVGRGTYPGALTKEGEQQEETWQRRLKMYLIGNMATSSFTMLIIVVILGILFSLFVFAKAFVCPDFAGSVKSNAWYCQKSVSEDEKKKQQQQQQQQQLGLPTPPVTDQR